MVSTTTNKLADDDPIIDADNPGAVIVATAVNTDADDAAIIVDLPTATVSTATLADDDPTIIAGHGPETHSDAVSAAEDDPAVDVVGFPRDGALYVYAREKEELLIDTTMTTL